MLPGYRLPSNLVLMCRILKWFTVIVAAWYVGLYVLQSAADRHIDYIWGTLSENVQVDVTPSWRKTLALKTVGTIAWFSEMLVLLGAFRLLHALQRGEAFALSVVQAIQQLGVLMLTYLAIDVVSHPLMVGIMTFGSTSLTWSISAGSDDAIILILAILFSLIGHVFVQAVKISDEHRQIV